MFHYRTTEKQEISIYEDNVWDCYHSRFCRTKFQINQSSKQEIQYSTIEGLVLRIDQITDISDKPEILTNLEQIKYLNWLGEYGDNLKKVGKWIAKWKGEILKGVGGCYSEKGDGQKLGLWKELIKNYWSKAQVYEIGEYCDGQRTGKWIYMYKNQEIGGGFYNKSGEKIGKWIVINDAFWEQSYVIFSGQYEKGKKVGLWDTYYNNNCGEQQTQLMGTGVYDEQGSKVGKWEEMSEGSWRRRLINIVGNYKKEQKVGSWDTYWTWDKQIIKMQIGGGNYDENGGNVKVGKWIDLNDGFRSDYQVIFEGDYKFGTKVGLWLTYWRWNHISTFEKIGGGTYDIKETNKKIGYWIEQGDNFRSDAQVITFEGDYQNDKKVGRWNYYWRENIQKNYEQMQQIKTYVNSGGGYYDKQGNNLKIGKWIEVSNKFFKKSKVIYKGTYKNNKKVGTWDEIKIDDNKRGKLRELQEFTKFSTFLDYHEL
ncbi:unnamed protein product (macronuclear) [Paramecium tetraurelia]|uniref:MORN repeat protein n=1 Tax=Paramecium tetraurelia TaxID=5888 RepID=A0BDR5_PARTE|nr:uncharacterized protein GSPATT00027712001 [Paramecium tetraurelia]CAK56682.1 unnamed protein product [Paramecium tetraurelia]|eukprot:XP_001424080.1 hypothetical protein (macronuclear) [Paramecium tetraurelia strain d4-2]